MTWRCECRARGIFELDEMKKTIYPSGQHIGKVHKDEGERAVGKNVASLLLSLFICPHWNVFFWFIRTLTTWKQGLYFHTWGEQHFITKPPNYTWQLAFVGGTSQSGTGCNLVIFTKALPREGAESNLYKSYVGRNFEVSNNSQATVEKNQANGVSIPFRQMN